MANVAITSDAWTEISITSGAVQNISATATIELSSEQTDNSGICLSPGEIYGWDNETIYARAVSEETGAIRVVNFKKAAGGGGGYVLPVASNSTLGGVKVGNNLTIDPDTGVLDATDTVYTLPTAAANTLGGVKVGNNLTIDPDTGVLSGTAVSGGQNYSTTEQLIGTWIDGKPLYQKTYSVTTNVDASPLEVGDLPVNVNNDNVVEMHAIMYAVDNFVYKANYYLSDENRFSVWVRANKKITCIVGSAPYFSRPCYITIKYTKTTD